MKPLQIALIAGLILTSCSSHAAQLDPGYIARAVDAEPSAASSTLPDRPFAEVAEARGMPPLRAVALPDGSREIRITESYGFVAGRQIPLLRIVVRPEGVAGELLIFWAEPKDPAETESRDSCAPLRDTLQTCVRIAATPDVKWDTVASRLNELGAWSIATRCEHPGTVSDAGELLIQRLEGSRFESYTCNAPQSNVEREAGRRSVEIAAYVGSLARSIDPGVGQPARRR